MNEKSYSNTNYALDDEEEEIDRHSHIERVSKTRTRSVITSRTNPINKLYLPASALINTQTILPLYTTQSAGG